MIIEKVEEKSLVKPILKIKQPNESIDDIIHNKKEILTQSPNPKSLFPDTRNLSLDEKFEVLS